MANETPVKRGRGRPKGSKNKPKELPLSEQLSSYKPKTKKKVVGEETGEFVPQPELEAVNKPKPEDEVILEPPHPSAYGMKWVFNRLPEPYETRFDGLPIIFQGHEFKEIQEKVAPHICSWSIFQLPASGPPVRALVLEGKKTFGKPIKQKRPIDMVDRSTDDQFKRTKLIYI